MIRRQQPTQLEPPVDSLVYTTPGKQRSTTVDGWGGCVGHSSQWPKNAGQVVWDGITAKVHAPRAPNTGWNKKGMARSRPWVSVSASYVCTPYMLDVSLFLFSALFLSFFPTWMGRRNDETHIHETHVLAVRIIYELQIDIHV